MIYLLYSKVILPTSLEKVPFQILLCMYESHWEKISVEEGKVSVQFTACLDIFKIRWHEIV